MRTAAILEQVRQMTEEQARQFALQLFSSLTAENQRAVLKLALELKSKEGAIV